MKSKILVEYDFEKNEPYLQLVIDDTCPPDQQPDMRDTCLKLFIELSKQDPYQKIKVVFQDSMTSNSNNYPQLRIGRIDGRFNIWENSQELINFLTQNNYQFEVVDRSIFLSSGIDPFIVGAEFGRFQQSQIQH